MSNPTVAIVGASADPAKFGNRAVRAHLAAGYDVYPVNPRGGQIEGLEVHASLADVPVPRLTRISLYVPPAVGRELLPEIAEKGCDELFLNPGSESPELVQQAEQLGLAPVQACSILDVGGNPHG